MPLPADSGIRANVQQPPAASRNYFLVPGAVLSMLEELPDEPDFIFPVAAPVVVPFFMFVCLVVLLVAPWPAFCSLDAPGAG